MTLRREVTNCGSQKNNPCGNRTRYSLHGSQLPSHRAYHFVMWNCARCIAIGSYYNMERINANVSLNKLKSIKTGT